MDDVLALPEKPGDETQGPDIEPAYGPVMQCEGRFEIDPIPGGKRFQGSWLVLDNGKRYVVSYRPVAKYFPFVDKRVYVTGRPYTPGRDTQHMMAEHFQVDTMELVPGETPYAETPVECPAPPLLHTVDEITACDGRWGQVVGQLLALEDDPDTYFNIAHLQLEDGTIIIARYASEQMWKPYIGSTITVMSRIEVITSETAPAEGKCRVALIGWYALCPGTVERCGMVGVDS